MADQGVWFKLWISALADPDLANLSLEDFARWAILGTYIKAHGTDGMLRLTAPARALSGLLQVGDFVALQEVFLRLPNVRVEKDNSTVSCETILTVSLRNWAKYQGDYSTFRVRKMREMKRSKRRGEEKRGEEKEKKQKRAVLADGQFLNALKANPAYQGINIDVEMGKLDAWLLTPKGRGKQKTRQRVVNWLNRTDRPMAAAATKDPYAKFPGA